MKFNKISYMVEDINGAFDPLGQLWKLGLAHNRIKSINKNAFTGLSNVTELDLSGNNITSIQENAFVSMTKLTKLRMNSSMYKYINIFITFCDLIFAFIFIYFYLCCVKVF